MTKINTTCSYCNNIISLKPFLVKRSKRHFCNKEHMNNYLLEHQGDWLNGPEHGFKKGQIAWNKGKKLDLEIRKKMSLGKIPREWTGFITPVHLSIRNSPEYKQWRESVFERDNWTCQECGVRSKENKRKEVEAHHIKSFSQILRENKIFSEEQAKKSDILWDINNGRTLCIDCHGLTKHNLERTY